MEIVIASCKSVAVVLASLGVLTGLACGRPSPHAVVPTDEATVVAAPTPAPPAAAGVPSAWFPGWWTSARAGWVVAGGKGVGSLDRTADGGATWSAGVRPVYLVQAKDMAVVDANHAFYAGLVGGAFQLWATEDGAHWSRRALPAGTLGAYGLSFLSPSEGWILAQEHLKDGTAATLWRTGDGGRSWSAVSTSGFDPHLKSPQLHFMDARLGFVSGLERSGFTPDPIGATEQPVVYRTGDGGATWTRTALPAPPDIAFPARIDYIDAVRSLDAAELVVDAPAYVGAAPAGSKFPPEHVLAWTSEDGGATWAPAVEAPASTDQFAAHGRSNWWAAGRSGLFSSTDAGHTWAGPFSADKPVSSIDFVDDSNGFGVYSPVGYGATGGSLLRTSDGGRTWVAVGST